MPHRRGWTVARNRPRGGAVARQGNIWAPIYYGARMAVDSYNCYRSMRSGPSRSNPSRYPRGRRNFSVARRNGNGTVARRGRVRVPWKKRKNWYSSGYAKLAGNQRSVMCQPAGAFPFARKIQRTLWAYLPDIVLATFVGSAPDQALCCKLPLRRIQNAQLVQHATVNDESSAVVRSISDQWHQFETPRFLGLLGALYAKFIVQKIRYELTLKLYSITSDAVLFWKIIYPHDSANSDVLIDIPYTQAGFDRLQRMHGVKCLEVRSNIGNGYKEAKLSFGLSSKLYNRSEMDHASTSSGEHLTWYAHDVASTASSVQQFVASTVAQPETNIEPMIYVWLFKRDSTTGILSTAVWDATDNNKVVITGKQISTSMFFHANPSTLAVVDDVPTT